MDLGLKGRAVLVTGGSQGIGRAIAELFGSEGASVAVTYCKNKQKAEQAAEAIRNTGGEAMVCQLDLQSHDSVRAAIGSVAEHWGKIDALINNAAVLRLGSQSGASGPATEEWQRLMRVNIEGTYASTHAVLPLMRARSWGRIVNISSVLAVDGRSYFAWYSAAKAAVNGLTRGLFRDLGRDGILINAVMPGLTLTTSVAENVSAGFRNSVARETPIRRLLRPEEVAPIVVFLASPANTSITGEIIRSSGGN
jgi:3-oxoacyl-[acyl-carrier protein] reductase